MLLKAQVLLWLLVATAWGRDFQGGNTIDWGTQNVGQGDVHIHSGALWSIINNAASDFHGNIQVDSNAGLYVSSVNPNIALSATLYDTIYEFVNNGVVSFNAIKGAPGYAFNIIGNMFENNGDLFYSASGEGSVVSTIKTPDFHNTGSLNFYQKMKSDSYVLLGADAKTFINNGQICFTNQTGINLSVSWEPVVSPLKVNHRSICKTQLCKSQKTKFFTCPMVKLQYWSLDQSTILKLSTSEILESTRMVLQTRLD
uniref:Hyphally-regulated cell wall protein N-terminal domain-containing protein n=1 Tax=Candida parapsilosis (strain CDC 317 / ATCC MYA-4646) TaxID=578454 RepID=A0AAJ8W7D8_CANPC